MAGEWLAQLPQDLQQNAEFTGHATIGDFAKSHLADKGKLTAAEGKLKETEGKVSDLEGKLSKSIPKLADNATDAQRGEYFTALGRPEKPEGYKFEGENLDPKAVKWAQETFFNLGLSSTQGTNMGLALNSLFKGVIEDGKAKWEGERVKTENEMKAELGANYDGSVEMIRRVWTKHAGKDAGDVMKEYKAASGDRLLGNDSRFIRFMLSISKALGEKIAPPGTPPKGGEKKAGIVYDKSPRPPARP